MPFLLFLVGGCTGTDESAPDLGELTGLLASDDPRIQEQALVPAVRTSAGGPPGVLPAGSIVRVDAGSWQVTGVGLDGTPDLGRVRASVTRPGEAATTVYLDVARVDGHWLLYETAPE